MRWNLGYGFRPVHWVPIHLHFENNLSRAWRPLHLREGHRCGSDQAKKRHWKVKSFELHFFRNRKYRISSRDDSPF